MGDSEQPPVLSSADQGNNKRSSSEATTRNSPAVSVDATLLDRLKRITLLNGKNVTCDKGDILITREAIELTLCKGCRKQINTYEDMFVCKNQCFTICTTCYLRRVAHEINPALEITNVTKCERGGLAKAFECFCRVICGVGQQKINRGSIMFRCDACKVPICRSCIMKLPCAGKGKLVF